MDKQSIYHSQNELKLTKLEQSNDFSSLCMTIGVVTTVRYVLKVLKSDEGV